MVAFPTQNTAYAGNAFLAYARKVLFRPTVAVLKYRRRLIATCLYTAKIHHSLPKLECDYNSLVALNLISGQRSSVNCKFTRLLAK